MSTSTNTSARRTRPYVRPMRMWWNRDPYFIAYMARELTAFAVLGYAIVLAVGLVRLSQGQAAWEGWVDAVRSPFGWVLHALFFVSFVVHSKSWFEIMPKTMPMLFMKGKRVPAALITRVGFAAAIACTVLLFIIARQVLS